MVLKIQTLDLVDEIAMSADVIDLQFAESAARVGEASDASGALAAQLDLVVSW